MADHEVDVTLAIVEPYFEAARDVYLEFSKERGLDVRGVKKVRLECRDDMHDTPRHFAGASEDGTRIAVAPEIVDLPEGTLAAIMAHEFGHIVDFLNPAMFICNTEEQTLTFVSETDADEARADKTRVARMRQWNGRCEHSIELTADLIAEAATDQRIGYSGPCMLQSFGHGVTRPEKLR